MAGHARSEKEESQRAARFDVVEPALLSAATLRELQRSLDVILSEAESIAQESDEAVAANPAEYARDIMAAARHFSALLDDHIGGSAWMAEPIEIGGIVREAARMLAGDACKARVRLCLPPTEQCGLVWGERRRVTEIAINLLGNAIRYAPQGSAVAIAMEAREGGMTLSVRDEGRGIAPADHERIFDKFQRIDAGDEEGAGLGLYISRGLAREMGGDIAVESALSAGACFTLILPAPPAP